MVRWLYVNLVLLVMAACGQKGNVAELEDKFPLGAEIEAYDAIPGLVRVQVTGDFRRIVGEGDFMNGVHHGTWTEYDSKTGFVTAVKSYYKGRLQGLVLEMERGTLVTKSYYHNDQLHGQQLVYDRRGILEENNYQHGVLHGMVRKFYPKGIPMEEATYKNGVIDGLAKWYDQDGVLKFQYQYKDGELIDKNPEPEQ